MNKYKLIKPTNKGKIFTVTMEADSNDGDYITATSDYTELEFEEIVDELIRLKKYYSDSHQFEDFYNTEYNIDIPYSEYGRCHTLSSIEIYCIDENGQYFEVELNLDDIVFLIVNY